MIDNCIFQDDATRSELQGLQDLPIVDEACQDDGARAGGRRFTRKLAQGIHARHLGHCQVEQQNIGPQRAHHVQGFNAVFRFGDDLHLTVGLQHIAQPNSDHGMIVGNQDLNGRDQL